MTRDDVKILEKKRPFDGYFKVDRYKVKHRLFEGGWSQPFYREVFERGHAVVVLLFDADRDVLVFVEQFRIGAYAALTTPWFEAGSSPWLIECVAGIIDEDEIPEEVANREALEETGCQVEEMVPIHHILASPGGCSESVFIYCAKTDASKADGIHGRDDENENIRAFVVPAAEAFEWLDDGRITHCTTIIALQWFRHNHREMRARWRNVAR